jgi:hypothetical protein
VSDDATPHKVGPGALSPEELTSLEHAVFAYKTDIPGLFAGQPDPQSIRTIFGARPCMTGMSQTGQSNWTWPPASKAVFAELLPVVAADVPHEGDRRCDRMVV